MIYNPPPTSSSSIPAKRPLRPSSPTSPNSCGWEHGLGFGFGVFTEVGVLEGVVGGDTLLRVEGKEGGEQRDAVGRQQWEFRPQQVAGSTMLISLSSADAGWVNKCRECVNSAPARPVRVRRHAHQLEYLGQLVDLALALEQRLLQYQLGKDAPDAPYVNRRPVLLRSQQQLGTAVPQRDDQLRQRRTGVAEGPRETKVRDFDLPAVVHEQVRRLEVAVHDPVCVHGRRGGEELQHECFDLGLQEGFGHVVEEGLEVVFDKVHDYVNPGRDELVELLADDDLAQVDDMRVSRGHQRLDLAQTGDREPIRLLLQLELLQRDDLAREEVPRARDDASSTELHGWIAAAGNRSRRDSPSSRSFAGPDEDTACVVEATSSGSVETLRRFDGGSSDTARAAASSSAFWAFFSRLASFAAFRRAASSASSAASVSQRDFFDDDMATAWLRDGRTVETPTHRTMKLLASRLSRVLLAELPQASSRRLVVAATASSPHRIHTTAPRLADDDDGLTRAQRVRKRIWGDAGPADPYKELTPEEREKREIALLEAEEAERAKEVADKRKAAKQQVSVEQASEYVPDTDARAMLIVGTRGAFRRREWDTKHKFVKFLGKRVSTPEQITAAVRRAAVETYAASLAGTKPTAACVRYHGPEYLTDYVAVTRAEGSAHSYRFDFRSPEIMRRIQEYTADKQPLPADRDIAGNIPRAASDEWMNLPLTDEILKFAVIKRSTQLTGIRLNDPIINDVRTVNQLLKRFLQIAAQSQTERLAPVLEANTELKVAPNVAVHPYQLKFTDRERAVGRLETIPIMMAGRIRQEGEVTGKRGHVRGGRRAVSKSMLRLRARKMKAWGVLGVECFGERRTARKAVEVAEEED
ncbi:hypothetical protein Dda_9128 [Drechslerella dactyloides]|uniref:Large ribosomal subunit protein mL50 n=1 Tax=Drechslerella dactyloides TaxID=74499 RepID=A0AAD6IS84_DREDA|nr:hypothetical protein Dda_9128 [Drechslerella dactyloides]